jgi:beta-glucosidase
VFTGCPIAMPWLDNVDAVIQCGYAGQELGYAVTDILSGVKNPSGRLVVTYPKRLEDNPSHGNFPGEGERVVYAEGTFVGYRHYVSRGVVSQFPFGFGLSYTSFSVDKLSVEGFDSFGPGRTCTLTVRVTNNGSVSGRHVVLLFVLPGDTASPVTRSAISLEAFAKTSLLEPGKSEVVQLQLAGDGFSHWVGDQQGHWEVAAGRYTLAIKDNAESENLLSIQCTIAKGWSWTGLRA